MSNKAKALKKPGTNTALLMFQLLGIKKQVDSQTPPKVKPYSGPPDMTTFGKKLGAEILAGLDFETNQGRSTANNSLKLALTDPKKFDAMVINSGGRFCGKTERTQELMDRMLQRTIVLVPDKETLRDDHRTVSKLMSNNADGIHPPYPMRIAARNPEMFFNYPSVFFKSPNVEALSLVLKHKGQSDNFDRMMAHAKERPTYKVVPFDIDEVVDMLNKEST